MKNDYFGKYLNIAPFALAIWRDQEARVIIDTYRRLKKNREWRQKGSKEKVLFERPLLDIGCGFGEFAGVFFDSQVEVGIDISINDLIRAKRANRYKKLIAVDARNLPFPDNTFATVISNSVLEHISNPKLCIKQAYRVLRPMGMFVFTVPTVVLNDHLFYPSLFKRLGLDKLASVYLTYYHIAFKHINVLSPQKWISMTQMCGFEILAVRGTFSSRLTKIFDIALATALPSQIARWLFGTRWIWALSAKRVILDPLYQYILRDKKITKSNILVIAKKP